MSTDGPPDRQAPDFFLGSDIPSRFIRPARLLPTRAIAPSGGMPMKTSALLSTLAFGVLMTGCSGPGLPPPVPGEPPPPFTPMKMTGGGWIPSAADLPGAKANFGFNASHCTVDTFEGHFNYHDKSAPSFQPGGVKMNGDVVSAFLCTGADCPPGCEVNSLVAEVEYRSTNPKFPGTGTARACVVDNGEGAHATAPDYAVITVGSGPFGPMRGRAGYANSGNVQGNIQFHDCTCNDGIDNDGNQLADANDPACIDPATSKFDPNGDAE